MLSPQRLRLGGYIAFSILSLLIGLYITFPGGAVAQRIAQELTTASGGLVTASISRVSLYWLTGIEAEDVRLKLNTSDPPVPITVDRFTARLQLLPLLWLQPTLAVTIEGQGAEIDTTVHNTDDGIAIEAEIDSFNLAKPPILASYANVPIQGSLSIKTDLVWSQDPRKSNGTFTMSLVDASVGPGTPAPGFSLPNPIALGQIDLAMQIEDGKAILKQLEQKPGKVPPDLLIRRGNFNATLLPSFGRSTYESCLEISLDQAFLKSNPKFEAIMDLATIGPPMGPGLKKDGDGFLHANFSGNFSAKPRFQQRLCTQGSARGVDPRSRRPPKVDDSAEMAEAEL